MWITSKCNHSLFLSRRESNPTRADRTIRVDTLLIHTRWKDLTKLINFFPSHAALVKPKQNFYNYTSTLSLSFFSLSYLFHRSHTERKIFESWFAKRTIYFVRINFTFPKILLFLWNKVYTSAINFEVSSAQRTVARGETSCSWGISAKGKISGPTNI